MNTNPKAKTVLCFGDSNTRGSRPDMSGRFEPDVRWTGILQNGLGDDYYVLEEGRGGRTTDLDHPDAPGRNGRQYLQPCLETHNPIDIIVIMLGTNDLKQIFKRSAKDIGLALEGLLEDVKIYARNKLGSEPQVIVVSPVHIAKHVLEIERGERFGDSAYVKSLQLADVYNQIAQTRGYLFFDAAEAASVGEDGVHIDKDGHKALGVALTKLVLSV